MPVPACGCCRSLALALRAPLHGGVVAVGELDAGSSKRVTNSRRVGLRDWRLTINALGAVNRGCCQLRTTT